MRFYGGIYDDILSIIQNWKPSKEYRSELGYRDELISYIRKQLNNANWLSSSHHSVQKEAGRSLADIGIDRKVGVELKLNLHSKSEVDRLIGQVKGFLEDYDEGVIVVLCGNTDEDKEDHLKNHLRGLSPTNYLGNDKRVKIIVKGSGSNDSGFNVFGIKF